MINPELFGQSNQQTIQGLMYRVYAWMGIGLAITAIAAYIVATVDILRNALYSSGLLLLGLIIAQLALVFVLSFFLARLPFIAAAFLFLLYSFVTGITLSSIFITFSLPSIFATFIITAGMFTIMSLYGYFTHADLSAMGNLLLMALIGLIIALFVNLFLHNSMLQMIISGAGVIIFTLLIAYDVQKIKTIGQRLLADHESIAKVALFGALTLYLDMVNLFLFLLNFTGQRRQN